MFKIYFNISKVLFLKQYVIPVSILFYLFVLERCFINASDLVVLSIQLIPVIDCTIDFIRTRSINCFCLENKIIRIQSVNLETNMHAPNINSSPLVQNTPPDQLPVIYTGGIQSENMDKQLLGNFFSEKAR